MNTLLVAATAAFLFLAPFASSAGLRSAMLIIAAIALACMLGRGLPAQISRAPRTIAVAFAAWVVLCVASLAWSELPAYTASELRAETLYGTLAFAVFHLATGDATRWRLWLAAILGGTLAVLAAESVQLLLPTPLSRHPLDGGPGSWSTHLVLIAPLLLALAWPPPWGRQWRGGIQALAFAALLLAAWETANRIIWAAFGAQLAMVVALRRVLPPMDGARRRNVRILVLAAVAVVVVAFGASIVERNHRVFSANAPFTTGLERDLRPKLWAVAWNEFKAAPWLGHGYGREILAERFLPYTPQTQNHPQLRHAHNVFIDVALQLGAVGLAIFVLLLAALAREYSGFLRDPAVAPLGIIGLAVIAGFLVKCLTDDFLHRHNALVFWALNGMLLGFAQRARMKP